MQGLVTVWKVLVTVGNKVVAIDIGDGAGLFS